MNKLLIWLISLSLLLLSPLAVAAPLDLDIQGGSWNFAWEQRDSLVHSAVETPLSNILRINNAPSSWFGIRTSVDMDLGLIKRIPLSYEYQTLSGSDIGTDTNASLSTFSGLLGLDLSWLMPTYRFEGSSASGSASGFDAETKKQGKINFNTEVSLQEVFINFPRLPWFLADLEYGIRKTGKTTPQSIYIMLNKSTLSPLASAKMIDPGGKWQSNYLMVGFNNTYQALESTKGLYWNYRILAGAGTAKLSSDLLTGLDDYVHQGVAKIQEVDISASYRLQMKMLYANFQLGYRQIAEMVELGQVDDVHIYAASESSYSGPYFLANMTF